MLRIVLFYLTDKTDKFRHSWVSCKISKVCGGAIAQLAKSFNIRYIRKWKPIAFPLKKQSDSRQHLAGFRIVLWNLFL